LKRFQETLASDTGPWHKGWDGHRTRIFGPSAPSLS
jgi:hypothetical protein